MQTFLPYPDFVQSMRTLDYRRLGKQRVEAYQILNTLTGKSNGWFNHPAVKMWRGYEEALSEYMNCAIEEWVYRGYQNNMKVVITDMAYIVMPPWIGDPDLHLSHQSNLLRKFPEHYSNFFVGVSSDLPYFWPIK